jgi:hypothetical protein
MAFYFQAPPVFETRVLAEAWPWSAIASVGKIVGALYEPIDDTNTLFTADWLRPAQLEMSSEITAEAGRLHHQLPSTPELFNNYC